MVPVLFIYKGYQVSSKRQLETPAKWGIYNDVL